MRYFIALELPTENKLELQEMQQQLHQLLPQARLTSPDKLHLTLAFIGEQPDTLQSQLTYIINNSVSGIQPFEVTPAYLDGFPSLHHPEVLWVGTKGDIDKILLIREKVKDGLADLNLVTDERRFVPHITVAKVAYLQVGDPLEAKLQQLMARHFQPIKVTSIKLFQSIPEGGLHKHNTLAEVKLL